MARKNALISTSFIGNVLTLKVGNDETGPIGEVAIDLAADLTTEIATLATVHGLTQKLSDAAALPKDELSGNAKADAKLKFEAIKAVFDRIIGGEGQWNANRGDGTGQVSGVIFRAFLEWATEMAKAKKVTPPTEDAIRAVYDAKDRAGQLALRTVPEIAAIIDRMKAEKGSASKVDASALLGELGL